VLSRIMVGSLVDLVVTHPAQEHQVSWIVSVQQFAYRGRLPPIGTAGAVGTRRQDVRHFPQLGGCECQALVSEIPTAQFPMARRTEPNGILDLGRSVFALLGWRFLGYLCGHLLGRVGGLRRLGGLARAAFLASHPIPFFDWGLTHPFCQAPRPATLRNW